MRKPQEIRIRKHVRPSTCSFQFRFEKPKTAKLRGKLSCIAWSRYLSCMYITVLEITVGHRTLSDQISKLSDQFYNMVGHDVRAPKWLSFLSWRSCSHITFALNCIKNHNSYKSVLCLAVITSLDLHKVENERVLWNRPIMHCETALFLHVCLRIESSSLFRISVCKLRYAN